MTLFSGWDTQAEARVFAILSVKNLLDKEHKKKKIEVYFLFRCIIFMFTKDSKKREEI